MKNSRKEWWSNFPQKNEMGIYKGKRFIFVSEDVYGFCLTCKHWMSIPVELFKGKGTLRKFPKHFSNNVHGNILSLMGESSNLLSISAAKDFHLSNNNN